MKLIDMHCDTLSVLTNKRQGEDLEANTLSVSIPGMQKAGTLAQFFACFTYAGEDRSKARYKECYEDVQAMLAYMEQQVLKYGEDIAYAYSYDDIIKNENEGKISVFLTVEEGGILVDQMERLEALYHKGIRLMTLMWNYENCLGYPNSTDPSVMWQGLKPFGREVVRRMGELGMIVDVSHASDGSFRDILEIAKGPVVASHSNCRALCSHPRNLTDEMIRNLANQGGIAGLNFYGAFLGTKDASLVSEMAEHILHMLRVGGSEFPAIGTDFDGFDGMRSLDIPKAEDMEKLWDALKKKGIAESQLDKIWSGNVLQILKML